VAACFYRKFIFHAWNKNLIVNVDEASDGTLIPKSIIGEKLPQQRIYQKKGLHFLNQKKEKKKKFAVRLNIHGHVWRGTKFLQAADIGRGNISFLTVSCQ